MAETQTPTARYSDAYMAANRIEINDNAVADGRADEPEYYVHLDRGPEGTDCACGCGLATTGKRNFLPGHDQRLMGILVRAHRDGLEVSWTSGGFLIGSTAMDYATQVLSDAGQAKLERYLATTPKRARKGAARPVEAPRTWEGKVKIGRWTYEARGIEWDESGKLVAVEYTNARKERLVSRQFTVVGS